MFSYLKFIDYFLPSVAMEDEGDYQKNLDEVTVIDCLQPLTKSKMNVLMHPLINTFVMIKYNSFALIFIFILLMKLIHAILISGLAVTELPTEENCTLANNITGNDAAKSISVSVWWYLSLVFTVFMLLAEIVEMIALNLR